MNLHRTRIKICGLTRKADVATAAELGADAVGFVFYPASKRFVTPVQARDLIAGLPAFMSSVALFVNPAESEVLNVINTMRPSVLQFHGDESATFCASFGLPYLKAFRVGAPNHDTPSNLAQCCAHYGDAAGWLFDSYTTAYGGSGQSFDYSLMTDVIKSGENKRPIILSGGLNHANVKQAVESLRPWAVDVSSGVELAPGVKSPEKISDFISAVKSSDSVD